MQLKTDLVIPSVGARPNLDTLSQIVRPAQEIGAQSREIFTLCSRPTSLRSSLIVCRSSVIETYDEQSIVNKTQAGSVGFVLCKCVP